MEDGPQVLSQVHIQQTVVPPPGTIQNPGNYQQTGKETKKGEKLLFHIRTHLGAITCKIHYFQHSQCALHTEIFALKSLQLVIIIIYNFLASSTILTKKLQ